MKRDGGFILPMVIFGLAIMGALLLVLLRTSDDDRMGSRYVLEGTRSFYAAESGLNKIIAGWITNNYGVQAPTVGSSADLGWQTITENQTRYHGVILKLATNTWLLTVDGQSGEARGGLRTVQVIIGGSNSSLFPYAAYGASGFTVSAGSLTDSWDSRNGAYAASKCTTSCSGDIASGGAMSLSGGTIKDSAFAAGGSPSGCSGNVTGGCAVKPAISTPPVACPAGFSPSSNVHDGNNNTYNTGTGNLSNSAGKPDTLYSADSPFRFNDVTLRNPLVIPPGQGHIDIYIAGTLTITAGAAINNLTLDPTRLTIWGCGSAVTTWQIAAGSNSYFAIYAPTHPIQHIGGAIYGALVGASIDLKAAGATVHYDEALGAGNPVAATVAGSWTEIGR